MSGMAYDNPVRNAAMLVNFRDDLLMGLVLDTLRNGFAHRADWISRIEYVGDDAVKPAKDPL